VITNNEPQGGSYISLRKRKREIKREKEKRNSMKRRGRWKCGKSMIDDGKVRKARKNITYDAFGVKSVLGNHIFIV
jgi:hypothetical protein